MNTIEQTINKAEGLGLKQQLLDWVENNKAWDPSLLSDQDSYYDIGLKIIMDPENQKFSDNFNNGFLDQNRRIKETGTVMINLFNNCVSKQGSEETSNKKFYSQLGQDLFVLNVLDHKRNGLFIDIGAGIPKFINNTYLLEKEYGWHGVSVDIDHRNKVAWRHSDRTSKFICESAFDIDYEKETTSLLKEHNATRIDYLSLDLEPPHLTLEALYKIITSVKCRFSIITFETDVWRDNLHIQKSSRELLVSHGYKLVVDNINNQEDWWIDITY